MRLFGLEIRRAATVEKQQLQAASNRGWFRILESVAGAWQSNVEVELANVVTHPTVFACVRLISSDIGKMHPELVERDADGIWTVTESAAFSPVLRKPNHFQNRIKFFQQWVISKLLFGNTYALKHRDNRRVVQGLFILDPQRVRAMIAPNGEVFYELHRDDLSGQRADVVTVPAIDIIHDVGVPLYHPLVGVSPITAVGIVATEGIHIIENSAKFFENGSHPGGLLIAPGAISQAQADELKTSWEANYGGDNFGRVAVLGNGLKYEAMAVNAHDSQLIEQLKMSSELICSAFGVPPHMVGVGPAPSYNNIEALNAQYYAQCLQEHIECIELSLDEGLGLTSVQGKTLGVRFNLDDLLRMDTATLISNEKEAVLSGLKSPNEARKRLNLKPAQGGNSPMMQQQQFSLAALAERDRDKPFAKPSAPTPATPATTETPTNNTDEDAAVDRFAAGLFTKLYAA